ncbi:MAG: ComEC/Rec2 family competence protein [Bacteroidales bacterium]|nr:ComEC/Rec2 family competence protein [Bacteroidales bacterium]
MTEEREYMSVTLAFAAGIAFAAAFRQLLPPHPSFFPTLMLACTAASACVLFEFRARGLRTVLPIALLSMFFCGIFSCLNSDIALWDGPAPHSKVYLRLRESVLGINFRNPRNNALLLALTCGDRSLIDSNLRDAFRDSGAAHILALSGLHLGFICIFIEKLLAILGNSPAAVRNRSVAIVALCGAYTWITGASPSIVRAFLFILVREWCRVSGRKSSLMRTWSTALVIQLALRPQSLFSTGFQLSYLAMAGIALVSPLLENLYPESERTAGSLVQKSLAGLDPVRKIWKMMSVSIACQCFTAPLAWIRFHSFPHYFLLTNLLAMPLASVVMFSGVPLTLLSMAGYQPELLLEICEGTMDGMVGILELIAGLQRDLT